MILLKMAFRNLIKQKVKTIVVGLIIIFGTFLTIVGINIVDTISWGMKNSIVNSVTGDFQVYSAKAKEVPKIFDVFMERKTDIPYIENFKKVNETLSKIENVKSVIPIGISQALFTSGNILDSKLSELRNAIKSNTNNINKNKIQLLKAHIIDIIKRIQSDFDSEIYEISDIDEATLKQDKENVKKALSSEFWKEFEKKPYDALEFLENKIAPLILSISTFPFFYFGTIPSDFQKAFPLFEIVKGETIPEGKRGILISELYYEKFMKNEIAIVLDKINEATKKGEKISQNEELTASIKELSESVRIIYDQLSPDSKSILIQKLKSYLNSNTNENNLIKLLQNFLKIDDNNFKSRYNFFYKEIAPKIMLYKINVGDIITISSFTQTGFIVSLNTKVYGIYRFKSLDKSFLSGIYNITDLMTFRDLTGISNINNKEEMKKIEKELAQYSIDVSDTSRVFENAISNEGIETKESKIDLDTLFKSENNNTFEQKRKIYETTYSREEILNGKCLMASIVLKNSADANNTLKEINKVIKKDNLDLSITDWSVSSGILGQFIVMMKIILYTAIFIIFLIAVIIIINSLVMVTIERTKEIGTMRAIGTQKSYVIKLFLTESLFSCLVFGAIGISLGTIVLQIMHSVGIPATNDFLYFLFSGPSLHPEVNFSNTIITIFITIIVSLISTLYPTRIAAKTKPVVAMQKDASSF